jgi:hypothetical protein
MTSRITTRGEVVRTSRHNCSVGLCRLFAVCRVVAKNLVLEFCAETRGSDVNALSAGTPVTAVSESNDLVRVIFFLILRFEYSAAGLRHILPSAEARLFAFSIPVENRRRTGFSFVWPYATHCCGWRLIQLHPCFLWESLARHLAEKQYPTDPTVVSEQSFVLTSALSTTVCLQGFSSGSEMTFRLKLM